MAELIIYGNIVATKKNETDVNALDVKQFISTLAPDEHLDVFINSFGGEVTNGLAIYQTIKAHRGRKNIYIDGAACSMASVIAFAGDQLFMSKSALLMIHLPFTGIVGNKFELQREIETLESIEQSLLGVYNANLLKPTDQAKIKQMVYDETWLTGEEAAKYFNITLLTEQAVSTRAASAGKGGKNILDRFQKIGASAANGQRGKNILDRFQKSSVSVKPASTGSVLTQMKNRAAVAKNSQLPSISEKVEDTKKNVLERFKK